MKPLLAHTYESHRWLGGPVWIQPKFNGVRALYQNGRFQSREEIPWNANVLAHLAGPLLKMFPDPYMILDGELYFHGWPLQRINGAIAVNRTEPIEDTLKIEYWVFDQVKYDLPFFTRFEEVSKVILTEQPKQIFAASTMETENRMNVEEFYSKAITDGFEGIMYRLGECPYTKPKQPRENGSGFLSDKNNRTWHLLKRKSWMDEEFTCLAVEEGVGKRAGMVGAFICDLGFDYRRLRVGSGLTDAEATKYFNDPPIGRKIKVKFQCYTRDGIPFNPTVEAVL